MLLTAPSEIPAHMQIELEDQCLRVKKLQDEIDQLERQSLEVKKLPDLAISTQIKKLQDELDQLQAQLERQSLEVNNLPDPAIPAQPARGSKWDHSKLEPYLQWKEHNETDVAHKSLHNTIILLNDSLTWSVQDQRELYSQLQEEDIVELLAAVYTTDPEKGIDLHKMLLLFLNNSYRSKQQKQIGYFHNFYKLLNGFFKGNIERECRAALRLWGDPTYGTIGREIAVYHLTNAFQKNPDKAIILYSNFLAYHPGLLINDIRLKELHEIVNPPNTSAGHRPWEFVFSSEFVIPHNPAPDPLTNDWLGEHCIAKQDPFSDWRSPLKDNAWLSNQSWPKPHLLEPELDNIHSIYHKLYSVDETWDLQASYCRLIADIGSNNLYQNTAFIVLIKTRPLYASNQKPEETIYRGIAHQWISYLLYHPRLFFNMSESDQIKLIELFIRVYGSSVKVEKEFKDQAAAIDNYHRWIIDLKNSKPDVDWPLLYPREEPYLRKQETTNLVRRIKKLIDHLRPGSDESPDSGNENFFELSLSLRPAWLEKTVLLFSLPDPLEHTGSHQSRNLHSTLKALLALSPKLAAHQVYFRGFTKNEYLDFQLPPNIERRVLRWDQDSLLDCLSRRVKLVSDDQLQSFDSLFSRRTTPNPSTTLAQCASGSPGRLVRLGHTLLTSHIQKTPDREQIDPDLLNSISS